MSNTSIAVLVSAVAFVVSAAMFPRVLRFARRHGIVDCPNARKLQRVPVPVFGGVVVYLGIAAGCLVLMPFMKSEVLGCSLLAMTVMVAVGMWDDIRDIPATLRLLVEAVVVLAFIGITGVYVDDLHGLWGINTLSPWVGIPLSVVAGVGTINAVNLIDGVDGYSSGYGVLSCTCFALAFWTVWDPVLVCLTVIVAGALVPFFLHNVFGVKSKMFIGDGGTLMLGTLVVVLSFCALSGKVGLEPLEQRGMCIPAFVMAVACIPLFDTLRVMTLRMLRGRSPFSADKTHLHHLFIDMGFSHLGAALSILAMNGLVILAWLLSWQAGAPMDVQVYIVVVLGLSVTFGFYKVMKAQQNGGPLDAEGYPQGTRLWHMARRMGTLTHREDRRFWRMLRNLMDGPMMRGWK